MTGRFVSARFLLPPKKIPHQPKVSFLYSPSLTFYPWSTREVFNILERDSEMYLTVVTLLNYVDR